MAFYQQRYRAKRVYEITSANGFQKLRLNNQCVELGEREFGWYRKVVDGLAGASGPSELSREIGIGEDKLQRFMDSLVAAGLLYERDLSPTGLSGLELHAKFASVLASWLSEAFAHPFWERMMTGKGSARLFTGWLIELYHYTKNANRHMPLSCAIRSEKPIKQLRAKHYAEEWNHYHYFMKSLKALGFTEPQIADSVPLPMTLALSNFMRQAAREDILAYSICSAVLEGTTTDRRTYNPYYEKSAALYDLPKEAIAPIYAHLDLDVQYQHSDLFREILEQAPHLSAERASKVLDYGHQLVEHIWLWTENIEQYYQVQANPLPRQPLDFLRD
jgi:pyrroloquinoline quinone (PQQ) biosynthesis protein C